MIVLLIKGTDIINSADVATFADAERILQSGGYAGADAVIPLPPEYERQMDAGKLIIQHFIVNDDETLTYAPPDDYIPDPNEQSHGVAYGELVARTNQAIASIDMLSGGENEIQRRADEIAAAAIIMQRQSHLMTDTEALSVPLAHEVWAAEMPYKIVGQVIRYPADSNRLYRVMQTVNKSLAHQPPGSDGMLAVYRPIDIAYKGTIDDPIPYVYGMDVLTGKYYATNDMLWRAKKDMLPCVWPPSDALINEWDRIG